MKILLLHDTGSPSGGAEQQILVLRKGLLRRGHEVRLLTSSARPGPGRMPSDYSCFGSNGLVQTPIRLANPSAVWQVRRALREFQPDVVHVQMFLTQLSPFILPLLRETPSLYYAVMYESICPVATKLLPDGRQCVVRAGAVCHRAGCLSLRAWVPLMLQAQLWRRWRGVFDLVVANSEPLGRRLVAEGIGPVEVVTHGGPISASRPPLVPPATVAFAGRLVREKGADLLLRAFVPVVAALPEARLLIAGDGPLREPLRRSLSALGLSASVSLLGHLTQPALERCFASAWVQVVPSLWAEPFGIVAVESMMRGTAVVASRTGGLAEIVADGVSGILVPPGDTEALGAAMLKILRDPSLAERLGSAGRELALAHYSQDHYVDRFEALYAQLHARGKPARGR